MNHYFVDVAVTLGPNLPPEQRVTFHQQAIVAIAPSKRGTAVAATNDERFRAKHLAVSAVINAIHPDPVNMPAYDASYDVVTLTPVDNIVDLATLKAYLPLVRENKNA